MSVICMCASEDCAVNGCQRLRALQKPPVVMPAQRGWVCAKCGAGVRPDVRVCPHCPPMFGDDNPPYRAAKAD